MQNSLLKSLRRSHKVSPIKYAYDYTIVYKLWLGMLNYQYLWGMLQKS